MSEYTAGMSDRNIADVIRELYRRIGALEAEIEEREEGREKMRIQIELLREQKRKLVANGERLAAFSYNIRVIKQHNDLMREVKDE